MTIFNVLLTFAAALVPLLLVLVLCATPALAATETLAPWWGITTGSRPTDLQAGVGKDAVQRVTVTATGGEFLLGNRAELIESGLTKGFAVFEWDATAAEVQSGLEGVYGAHNVQVSGGPAHVPPVLGEESWSYVITFTGALSTDPVQPIFTTRELKLTTNLEGTIDEERGEAEEVVKGTPDGQIVVEAENLGDTAANACSRVAPGKGKFKDAACTVAAAPGEEEFEKTPVTITDRLPEGLTAVAAKGIEGEDEGHERGKVNCVLASAGKAVTCTFAEASVPAYEQIEILISVRVEPGAKSGPLNAAAVSGGGATGTRTATHPIEVNGRERFGIESYTIVPEGLGGTVDTQAGSHPFQLTSVITANSAPPRNTPLTNNEDRAQTVALVKDEVGELPAGFLGNPTPFGQCTDAQFATEPPEIVAGEFNNHIPNECPASSAIGVVLVRYSGNGAVDDQSESVPIFNMVPLPGEPARFGFKAAGLISAFLDASVRTGSDYGVTISSHDIIESAWVLSAKLTFWGVPGSRSHDAQRGWGCLKGFGACPTSTDLTPPPLLIMPTSCERPFSSTLHADSWPYEGKPSEPAEPFTYTLPERIDGCNHLPFSPSIEVTPDVLNASTSTGLNVTVHLPQTAELNPEGLAEATLRNTTVTLPAGVAVNPSGANGLEACSANPGDLPGGRLGSPGDEIGYQGSSEPELEPGLTLPSFTSKLPGSFGTEGEEALLQPGINFCANASKIGEVTIKSPLLPADQPVKGFVYLADQNANPFGSLLAMYAVAEDPVSGTLIKLPFNVSLNPGTDQLVATSDNSPELPFETAEFHFFGGERAPLATPSRCGAYTTTASLTPWSAEADDEAAVTAHVSSTFDIASGRSGSACPGAALPFNPALTGGATNVNAGVFSPFSLTISRKDGEQNLQSVEAKLPPGLSGVLSNIELCPEPQANLGECGPNSLIGETTVSVGVGGDPFSVSGGKFYLTGPYNGSGACTVGTPGCAPFGITFEVPAKAGPFDLERNTANPAGEDPCDCVLVRGKIEINPLTSAITITSNPPGTPDAIPTSIEGIPLEIQHINAITSRNDFQFNPTNCSKMEVTGTMESSEKGKDTIGVPFQVTNCRSLAFTPKFKVSVGAKTSKADGASLTTSVTEPAGALGTQANLARVKVELPKQLPSRLTTLQKACTSKQFELNPANCPSESKIGYAKVITPDIPVPLEGPAIFVSHGDEAFPSLTMVLQGYGITIDLVGTTFISKAGITSTTFKTVPDQPFSSFTLTLPTGKYSALTALGNVCKEKLSMPTEFIAQNGAEIHETTPIEVTGCSTAISIVSHKVKGRTLTVSVSVPAAGRITASGKGLSSSSKAAKGRETLTFKLTQKKGGKLKTTLKIAFKPSNGNKQAKTLKLHFSK
jgi:hypothetical protein